MLSRLFMLLGIVLLGWMLGRFLRQAGLGRREPPRTPQDRNPPAAQESMVRDRVCGTFLPRSSALSVEAGSEKHFFCSDECRRTFLAQLQSGNSGGS